MLLQNTWCMVTSFFTVKHRTMKPTDLWPLHQIHQQWMSSKPLCYNSVTQKSKTLIAAVRDVMMSNNKGRDKVASTSVSHAMHRQNVGIKRFPIFLYVVLLTEGRFFSSFFFQIQTLKPWLFSVRLLQIQKKAALGCRKTELRSTWRKKNKESYDSHDNRWV